MNALLHHNHETDLLLLPQCKETDARNLDNLEANTRNITLGLAATTKARDEDLVVLVDEVQATIILKRQISASGRATGPA